MDLVVIYGPPAVGKLTVARELASLTGLKVFHNHLSIDCVLPVFDYGTRPYGRLVEEIRLAVIGAAAREGTSLAFTFIYKHPHDTGPASRICDVVESQGGRVCPVQLTCRQDVLEQRVQLPERAGQGKIDSVALLREYLAANDTSVPVPGRDSLCIDNTELTPREAAQLIEAHFGLEERLPG